MVHLFLHAVLCFMIVGFCGPLGVSAQEFTTQQVADFDWKRFGREVVERADYYTKKRISQSTEERARYIADEVGRQFNSMRVMPNNNLVTRGISWKRYGNQAIGTCEHVTDSLRDAMAGGGIDERRLLRVFGEKTGARSANPLDVNRNHMALALVGDKGVIVAYDLWMHGGQRGTFGSFGESVWNGQTIENWSDIMQKYGYLMQACEDCPDRSLKAPYQMVQTLKDQADLVTRILSAVPRGSVRFTVVDSVTGEGLANSHVAVDGAVNSPVEKIRQSSLTDAKGTATIGGISQGPYVVLVSNASCETYKSGITNIKPQSSFTVRLVCRKQPDFQVALHGPNEGTVNDGLTMTAAVTGWSGPLHFKWTLASGGSCGNTSSCSLVFSRAGTYDVTVSATAMVQDRAAATRTASKKVTIRPVSGSGHDQGKPKPTEMKPGMRQEVLGDEQVVAEYRTLLPSMLSFDKRNKPWITRFEILANAILVRPGEYKVNYRTYCIIESGPDKGKDHKCFEYDGILNLGQIKTAVADMKRTLR